MLNEKNIQACFQYNASTGDWVFEKVEGSLLIDVNSPRVRGQVGSDKIAIDLGYSVDGKVNDWKFTVDGIGMLAIKTVAMRNDLIRLPIEKNECAIVTNDPNFRTILWLNYESHGKKLNYSFTTLNSGLGSWQFNEVAKKLNAYNPEGLDNRITDTENRVTNAEGKLNTAETNIIALQTGLSEEITARETADTEEANTRENADNALNTRLVTIEEHTKGFTRNNGEEKTNFKDSIISEKDLGISGHGTFGGGISVINGDSTFENTSVKDLTIRGVVNGELKDKDGFKWEKVRYGTMIDTVRFKNILIKQKSNGECEINAVYNESINQIVEAFGLSKPILRDLPIAPVESLRNVSFTDITNQAKFIVLAQQDTNSNITGINIIFRNITNIENDINGYKANIIINCIKAGEISNVTWL